MATMRLALLVAAGSVAVTACSGSHHSSGGTVQLFNVADRVPAPAIEGPTLNGGVVNLRDYAGRVVVLNFWGSWCPPCRAEQAMLNKVYTADYRKGVAFIGVDIQDNKAAARSFLRANAVRYPSIVDEPDSIALTFNPRLPATPPITVVIDRQGRIAAKILGGATGILTSLVDQYAGEPAT
ncbi:MAG: TlpA family protein disulfide reductase [Actinomycetes bacterium]